MTRIIQCVETNYEECSVGIKESFLSFVEIHSRPTKDMTNFIIQAMKEDGLK